MTADPSTYGQVTGPVGTPAHTTPPPRALPGSGEVHRHVLVAIVLNKPGVLNRVSSLMRARNFNIDSLAVSHTDQPDVSRMTITLHGDDVAVEQAAKQLYRLIDVLKVQDVTSEPTIEHELALVKIRANDAKRAEVLKLVELAKGRVIDVATDALVAEITGTEAEIDTFVGLVRGYGIKELVRTGAVVMSRGSASIEESSGRWRRGAPPRVSEDDRQLSVEGASSGGIE
jgi:acetolactate synthase-1/3 small subunit